jgi:hypothetical protein
MCGRLLLKDCQLHCHLARLLWPSIRECTLRPPIVHKRRDLPETLSPGNVTSIQRGLLDTFLPKTGSHMVSSQSNRQGCPRAVQLLDGCKTHVTRSLPCCASHVSLPCLLQPPFLEQRPTSLLHLLRHGCPAPGFQFRRAARQRTPLPLRRWRACGQRPAATLIEQWWRAVACGCAAVGGAVGRAAG